MYANTPEAQNVVDRMQAYGVAATGEVVTQEYHDQVSYEDQMSLAEVSQAGGRISRVRVLREYGRCDISYIHATVPGECEGHESLSGAHMGETVFCDGTCEPSRVVPVRLDMPSSGIGIPFRGLKGEFIAWAKEQGVFAKGLGLLDEGNWSVLG